MRMSRRGFLKAAAGAIVAAAAVPDVSALAEFLEQESERRIWALGEMPRGLAGPGPVPDGLRGHVGEMGFSVSDMKVYHSMGETPGSPVDIPGVQHVEWSVEPYPARDFRESDLLRYGDGRTLRSEFGGEIRIASINLEALRILTGSPAFTIRAASQDGSVLVIDDANLTSYSLGRAA